MWVLGKFNRINTNECMPRLSSENVSSPYDDRLDKVDPDGELGMQKSR